MKRENRKRIKDFIARYFKTVYTIDGFKNKNIPGKVTYFLIAGVFLLSSRQLFVESVVNGIIFLVLTAAIIFIVGLVLFFLIEGPDEFIYKDILKLIDHVSGFFSKDFYRYEDYIYKDHVEELKRKVEIGKLPTVEMLHVWKYRLSERQIAYQVGFPVVAVMMITLLNQMGKDPVISTTIDHIVRTIEASNGKGTLDSINNLIEIMKYPYLIIAYFSKLDDVGRSIHKVDLLIALKTNVTSANTASAARVSG